LSKIDRNPPQVIINFVSLDTELKRNHPMGNTATAPVLRPITAIALREIDQFIPIAQSWVTLRDLPSDYSYDQALLICKADEKPGSLGFLIMAKFDSIEDSFTGLK
jgi:hypothetical protein